MYVIVTGEDGKPILNKDGLPEMRMLTSEEKLRLEPGSDNKVHIASNGIFNDVTSAAKYANQHGTGDGPQYFIHFPEAESKVSELMIAGYQKYMEGSTLGLTNATTEMVEMMDWYGQTGLHLDGHSRGSMTVGNALEVLQSRDNATGLLSNTTVSFFGPAYNAKTADGILSILQGRSSVDDIKKYNSMILTFQNHYLDPVGNLNGFNPATGGSLPEGSSVFSEFLNVMGGAVTVHNCYAAGVAACAKYWKDGPVSQPATPLKKKKVEE
jgi:filamentous hemagglutinin